MMNTENQAEFRETSSVSSPTIWVKFLRKLPSIHTRRLQQKKGRLFSLHLRILRTPPERVLCSAREKGTLFLSFPARRVVLFGKENVDRPRLLGEMSIWAIRWVSTLLKVLVPPTVPSSCFTFSF